MIKADLECQMAEKEGLKLEEKLRMKTIDDEFL